MSEPNERNVSCDAPGCGNYFFLAGSCLFTEEQIDAVGEALGWTFPDPDGEGAFCPHHPPKSEPPTKKKAVRRKARK